MYPGRGPLRIFFGAAKPLVESIFLATKNQDTGRGGRPSGFFDTTLRDWYLGFWPSQKRSRRLVSGRGFRARTRFFKKTLIENTIFRKVWLLPKMRKMRPKSAKKRTKSSPRTLQEHPKSSQACPRRAIKSKGGYRSKKLRKSRVQISPRAIKPDPAGKRKAQLWTNV